MNQEEVEARIERLRGKRTYADEVQHAHAMNQQRKPDDATVYLPPEPPPAPRVEKAEEAPLPRMPKGDVIMPDGTQHTPPMVVARFRAFWVDLVQKMFPGEVRQPTLSQFEAWRAEDMKPENHPPAPLARLIEVGDDPVGDLTGWHGPQYGESTPPSRGNPGLRSSFGGGRS